MKKQITVLKLTGLAAMVAMLSVGCASSGHARVDADDDAMGAGGRVEVGTDADADVNVDIDDNNVDVDADIDRQNDLGYNSGSDLDIENADNSTVSALGSAPETRPQWINRFGASWAPRLRVIEVYTFTPDNSAEFSANTPAGSAYVEAAGGTAPRGRVIRHSPNPW